jgi:Ca2+-binding EF-hand superfamily protein
MSAISAVGPALPQAMSGASMRMPPNQKMTNLFSSIDTTNSGSINQSQFNQAFSTMNPPAAFKSQGAQAIWNQLDQNNTGSVSKQDFVGTMKQLMVSLRSDPAQTLATSQQSLGGIYA